MGVHIDGVDVIIVPQRHGCAGGGSIQLIGDAGAEGERETLEVFKHCVLRVVDGDILGHRCSVVEGDGGASCCVVSAADCIIRSRGGATERIADGKRARAGSSTHGDSEDCASCFIRAASVDHIYVW